MTTKSKTQTAPVADVTKRAKGQTEAQMKAEKAAVIVRETILRDANGKARDALAASIRGRFTDCAKIEAADLAELYPNVKTRANRVTELNASMAIAHLLGAENAEALLADALTYGSRLRDDWARACTLAKGHMNRLIGAGTARANARPEAMRATFADLKAARALQDARDNVAALNKAASKLESQRDAAQRYVNRLDTKKAEGQDVDDALATAETAFEAAAKAAKAARDKADKAAAKLPQPAPAAPPTVEAAVQGVKVAMGARELPIAALGAIARDLVAKCNAAGATEAAKLIGKAAELLG